MNRLVLMLFISITAHAASKITVTSATYGKNCYVPVDNALLQTTTACSGLESCTYRIELDDPAYGCAKDFDVSWTCDETDLTYSTRLAREAFGKTVHLGCNSINPAQHIKVISGTYGGNCQNTYEGNATPHLHLACESLGTCAYEISQDNLGDPSFGCLKTYLAKWRCSNETFDRSVLIPGPSEELTAVLSCP